MIYIKLRVNVADYEIWRKGLDTDESHRRSVGSTGNNQFYRDVNFIIKGKLSLYGESFYSNK